MPSSKGGCKEDQCQTDRKQHQWSGPLNGNSRAMSSRYSSMFFVDGRCPAKARVSRPGPTWAAANGLQKEAVHWRTPELRLRIRRLTMRFK
jgi:hypothetical protein